jgi:fucose permease
MVAGLSGDRERVGVAVAFLGHAVIFGTWASRIPAVKHALGLSDAQLGLAFFGAAAGTLIGSRLGGALTSRVRAWRVVQAGLPVLAAGLVVAALAGDQATLTAALVALGVTAAVVDVAMNSEAVVVERARGKPLMSGFHGFWSVGLMVGAVAGIGAAALDLRPAVHFALAGVIVAAGSAPFLARLPHRSVPNRTANAAGGWSPKLVVLGLIAFCAFFAEGAAADWSAVYLRDRADAGAAVAAAAFASFSLAMATSRLAGNRLAAGFGPVRLARAASVMAGLGLALALLVPTSAAGLLGFALLGAGIAPIVPTVISAAGGARLGTPEAVVSRVFAVGYVGGIIGPALIGFTAGQIGLRAALAIPVCLIGLIAIASGRLATAAGGS